MRLSLHGFNPRTREGANDSKVKIMKDWRVSIHAPVKVRTYTDAQLSKVILVSIHAPVKVRTLDVLLTPRLHHVSIHAPVKVRTSV